MCGGGNPRCERRVTSDDFLTAEGAEGRRGIRTADKRGWTRIGPCHSRGSGNPGTRAQTPRRRERKGGQELPSGVGWAVPTACHMYETTKDTKIAKGDQATHAETPSRRDSRMSTASQTQRPCVSALNLIPSLVGGRSPPQQSRETTHRTIPAKLP